MSMCGGGRHPGRDVDQAEGVQKPTGTGRSEGGGKEEAGSWLEMPSVYGHAMAGGEQHAHTFHSAAISAVK
ncbi:unnamed protein product [Nippostrongylus brasiliensis]|uniref:Uncharacterized protein n=1 Tax=Nippostrongylus brasiliensis TaxID=27835 RepID=A0A0N4XCB9_NIPBR|nr:hypothetical protein Q1695_015223 [Nippostrongylus brasiliensis]VDL62060.1 unnamed protein product [Nippostrongylus brasiliensis]